MAPRRGYKAGYGRSYGWDWNGYGGGPDHSKFYATHDWVCGEHECGFRNLGAHHLCGKCGTRGGWKTWVEKMDNEDVLDFALHRFRPDFQAGPGPPPRIGDQITAVENYCRRLQASEQGYSDPALATVVQGAQSLLTALKKERDSLRTPAQWEKAYERDLEELPGKIEACDGRVKGLKADMEELRKQLAAEEEELVRRKKQLAEAQAKQAAFLAAKAQSDEPDEHINAGALFSTVLAKASDPDTVRLLNLLQPVISRIQSGAGVEGFPAPSTPTGAEAAASPGGGPVATEPGDDEEPAMDEDSDLLEDCAQELEQMADLQTENGNLEQGKSLLAKAAKARDRLKHRTAGGLSGVRKSAGKSKANGSGGGAAAVGAETQPS